MKNIWNLFRSRSSANAGPPGARKTWRDTDLVWAIWLMASQDGIAIISYQSVATRLYGQLNKIDDLNTKVGDVRRLVGVWRELFRPGAHEVDFKKWKGELENGREQLQAGKDPGPNYPDWLSDLSFEEQKDQIANLEQNVFRSQFRERRASAPSGNDIIRLGLDYINNIRSALLAAEQEDRANVRERQKHRIDRLLAVLAVAALIVPTIVTAASSYYTYRESHLANNLKGVENRLRETEVELRRDEKTSRDEDTRRNGLKTERDSIARFMGLLTKVYATSLSGDKNQCITLTGDLDSAFSILGTKKRGAIRPEHQAMRQLCIDALAGTLNIAERRTQAEQMIEQARAALEQ